MVFDFLYIFLGIAGLSLGAESLVKGSASFAARLNLSKIVIGLTVVGWGTSTPELVVSIQAAWNGQGDVALGNVMGSNIANVGLILSLVALMRPIPLKNGVARFDLFVMAAATLIFFSFYYKGFVGRVDGVILLFLVAIYTYWTIKHSKAPLDESLPKMTSHYVIDLFLIVVGLIILIVGGHLFLRGAISIAKAYGVSEAVIGLSLVAIGTSLPELAISLVAAFRRHSEIALGNIIGSNIYNLMTIVGVASLFSPLYFKEIEVIDIAALFFFTALLIISVLKGRNITRTVGSFYLASYIIYIFWLYTKV